jgi:hypothetical protein
MPGEWLYQMRKGGPWHRPERNDQYRTRCGRQISKLDGMRPAADILPLARCQACDRSAASGG